MNREAASGESAGRGRALGADQSSSTVSRRNCRKASRLKCANTSAEKTGSTSHAGGSRLMTERHPPISHNCLLWRRHMILRSFALACSTMASTRSILVNANAHQNSGKIMASGGISHSGMVSIQPTANSPPTQTAFQTPTVPENCPCLDTPLYSRCSRRSEEHTSELQSLMRISYAVFCLNKTNKL